MSRIARSARVGSRNRMEAITADKTLTQAESGETYLIDWDTGSALTINLPAMQDGAYFKFVFKSKLDNTSASVVINSADNTAGDFAGSIFEQLTGGSNANSAFVLCGSHDILTISDNVDIGSWLEVYCDGSTWYWTGALFVDAVARAVFTT